jgi:cobalamin synthase
VPDDDAPTREPRDAIMQRVRVGLTGLAAVFLLTLLAASILGMLGQDDPRATRLANGSVAANMAATPKEPLAELGVAPGANVPPTTTPVIAAPTTGAAMPAAKAPAPRPQQSVTSQH